MAPLYQAKADLLRVLGHPARIRVLELLAERDLAAGELLAEIPIEAGSLSQQLAVLRRAGLVGQRREATGVVYSLLVPEVRHVLAAARRVLSSLPADGDALPVDVRAAAAAGSPLTLPGGVVGTAAARRSLAG
jgi:ArsR family transcriptional regulator